MRRLWVRAVPVTLGLTACLAASLTACSSGSSSGPTLSQTAPPTSTSTAPATTSSPAATADTATESVSPSGTGGPILPGSLSPAEFQAVTLRPNVIIVDVRPLADYKAGHLPKAVNLDYSQPDFAAKFSELDVTRSFALYDDSGTVSRQVIATLAGMGYLSATDLKGGFQAWKAAGLPIFTGVPDPTDAASASATG